MAIFRKQNGFKQFLALLVVFTLICPSVLSAKKEKRGAWLKVTMQDMQVVEGELLNVKGSEIVLMSNSETGITIPLTEIRMIEYKKKGKFGTGFVVGLGLSILVFLGTNLVVHETEKDLSISVVAGAIVGLPCGLLFGILDSHTERKKAYNFRNVTQQQFSKNLEKLKTIARF
ncbi:MAG TPA: hypothetical protein VK186_12975 [Candidatus Deferrimicrobium sp.]|nr:hypothetical protein [Candidatus Deferrimicrobium sp.]